jgi:hypothetical protein
MECRPLRWLSLAQSWASDLGGMKDCWRHIGHMRQRIIGAGNTWPKWCYMPTPVMARILYPEVDFDSPRSLSADQWVSMMGISHTYNALAAWRSTKGIYRFHPDILEDVWAWPMDSVPVDVFMGMMEWCYYVETPGRKFEGLDLAGFFFYLDYTIAPKCSRQVAVVFIPDLIENGNDVIGPIGYFPLEEGKPLWHLVTNGQFDYGVSRSGLETYEPLLACVLYMHDTAREDISDPARPNLSPSFAKPVKVKKATKLLSAQKPTVWEVGVRYGPALKRAKRAYEAGDGDSGESEKGSPKRPHIRRGHKHHVWVGQKGTPSRRLVEYWFPFIRVNHSDPDDIAAVIRSVV